MSEPTYRIKPLVWVRFPGGLLIAEARPLNHYTIVEETYSWTDYATWHPADSLEAAKAACEQHYRERLMEALEEVT